MKWSVINLLFLPLSLSPPSQSVFFYSRYREIFQHLNLVFAYTTLNISIKNTPVPTHRVHIDDCRCRCRCCCWCCCHWFLFFILSYFRLPSILLSLSSKHDWRSFSRIYMFRCYKIRLGIWCFIFFLTLLHSLSNHYIFQLYWHITFLNWPLSFQYYQWYAPIHWWICPKIEHAWIKTINKITKSWYSRLPW